MDRIGLNPEDYATAGRAFTEGNPATGVPPTRVRDYWLTAVQEELAAVIEGAAIELDPEDLTQLYQAIQALIAAAVPVIEDTAVRCNCYLSLSGANLRLSRSGGRTMFINGVAREIPEAGVTIGSGGLAVSTWGYVYAYWTGAAIALECNQTAYVLDSTMGIPVKSGDASRTLVGMWSTDGTPVFNDAASYWNRRLRAFEDLQTGSFAIASVGFVAISPSTPVDRLFWADSPAVAAGYSAAIHATDLGYVGLALGETSAAVSGKEVSANPKTSQALALSVGRVFAFTEGRHKVYLLGKSNHASNAATYQGFTLTVFTMG